MTLRGSGGPPGRVGPFGDEREDSVRSSRSRRGTPDTAWAYQPFSVIGRDALLINVFARLMDLGENDVDELEHFERLVDNDADRRGPTGMTCSMNERAGTKQRDRSALSNRGL